MITDMLTTPCTVTATRMVSTPTAIPIIRNPMDLLPPMTGMVDMVIGRTEISMGTDTMQPTHRVFTVTAMRMVTTPATTPIIRNPMGPLPRMMTAMLPGTRRLIRLRCMVTGTLTTIMAPHSCTSHTVMGTVRQTASPSVCLAPTTAPVWLS